MNNLLARQLRKASRADGTTDLEAFYRLVSDHYDAVEAERERAGAALRDVSGRYRQLNDRFAGAADARALLDTVAEALLAVDPTGVVRLCNAQARVLFRTGSLSLTGRPLDSVLSPPPRRSVAAALERWVVETSAPGQVSETRAQTLDGRRFPAAVRVRASVLAGESVYMISVRDVGARHAGEQRRERDRRVQQLIGAIGACFVAAHEGEDDTAIGNGLTLLRDYAGVQATRIYEFTRDSADRSDLVDCTHELASPGHTAPRRLLLDTELPWLAAKLRQLSVLPVGGLDALPAEAERERQWFGNAGTAAFVIVPLRCGTRATGFLTIESDEAPRDWPPEMIAGLRLIGDLFGTELRRREAAAHEKQLMSVLDGAPDIVALSDRAGQLLYLNESGRRQLGLGPDDALVGRSLREFWTDDADGEGDIHPLDEGLRCAVRDGRWRTRLPLRGAGDDDLPVSQITLAHRAADGTVEFFSTIARDMRAQHEAEQRQRESEQRLRLALQAAGMYAWDWDVTAGTMRWSAAGTAGEQGLAPAVFGSSLESLLARVHEADRLRLEQAVARALANPDENFRCEYRVCGDAGKLHWIDMCGAVHSDYDGRAQRMIGTLADISESRRAREALAEERERALITLNSIGDGVVTIDEHGLVDSINPVAEQRLGVNAHDVAGRLIDELFALQDADAARSEHPVLLCLREGRPVETAAATLVRGPAGEKFAIQFSAAPMRSADGAISGAVMVFRDISEERSLYQRLSYQARHDALTGLVNRRELEDRLSEKMRESWRNEGLSHSLLYLDVDQFKVVNDICGHAAGDELLRRIVALVREQIRVGDSLARIGGDEFCVLLADCPLERAERIAESIRTKVGDFRFVWGEQTFSTSLSIGLVGIDAHSQSIADILSAADVACHAAKQGGRNRVSVYRADIAMIQHREMQWVSRITQACEDDRLTLFYHPIVPADGGAPRHHYELLLRMRDAYGKLVPPNAFIPAAERYNLMPMIDRWVVQRALSQLVQPDNGELRYTLAVNLSGSSLSDPQFLDFVRRQLETRSLPSGAVCFEITETAAIGNLDQVVRFMHEMRELGCQFSLDDFGSGLSSFAYLKDLPVDYLKIDRLFVRNIATDVVDHSMVAAINQVGQVMGVKTIAEGVENEEVLAKVCAAGIDYAQGFLFGEPAEIGSRDVFEPRPTARIIPLAG